MISLLLHKTEAEPRSSVITTSVMVASIPNKAKTGNYVITSCLVKKRVGDNYPQMNSGKHE